MSGRGKLFSISIFLLFLLLIVEVGYARVGLVTLPDRSALKVKLKEDGVVTVQEERNLALNQGINTLQLSWINVNVDLNSVQILVPSDSLIRIKSIKIPQGTANSLIWEAESPKDQEVVAQITYTVNGGLNWQISYLAIADDNEKEINLKSEVKLFNFTPDDYKNASIQIGTGRILNETLDAGKTKKLEYFKIPKAVVSKIYTSDPRMGDLVAMSYMLKNDLAHGLGTEILFGGKVRLYRADPSGDLSFIGEDLLPLTPLGAEIKLFLGNSRDISVERKVLRQQRVNERRDKYGNVQVYDTDEKYQIKIKNHKDKEADLILKVYFNLNGHWKIKSSHEYVKEDAATIKYTLRLPANSETNVELEVSGINYISGWAIGR